MVLPSSEPKKNRVDVTGSADLFYVVRMFVKDDNINGQNEGNKNYMSHVFILQSRP
jgi:hypothetical protein